MIGMRNTCWLDYVHVLVSVVSSFCLPVCMCCSVHMTTPNWVLPDHLSMLPVSHDCRRCFMAMSVFIDRVIAVVAAGCTVPTVMEKHGQNLFMESHGK